MKKIDLYKTAKTIGIILLIVMVFLYMDYRDSARINKIEKYADNLLFVSEELEELREYCRVAEEVEDYENLCISMYHVQEKCTELQKIIDESYEYFRVKD